METVAVEDVAKGAVMIVIALPFALAILYCIVWVIAAAWRQGSAGR